MTTAGPLGGHSGAGRSADRLGTDVPLLVGGDWIADGAPLRVYAGGGGPAVGSTFEATPEQLDAATAAAVAAFAHTRRSATYERSRMLRRVAELMEAHVEELATSLALEIAKPIADARLEVVRTAMVWRMAGEEAERLGGEVLPLDLLPTSRGRHGVVRRLPLGPVAAIAPFNVPLSLASHKVAPALAAGNTVVLKPDSRVALTWLRLAELIVEAGVPHGALSVLPMTPAVADAMVTDPRFRLLTFTGSVPVGWDLRARAGTKRVVLELGGIAPVIVDETADLDLAVARSTAGGFKYAGQLCIAVQRAVVHASVVDAYGERLAASAAALRTGDVLDEATQLGPMIGEPQAARAMALIEDALDQGATLLTGGTRDGAFVAPTVLRDVPVTARLWREEAFSPIVTVSSYDRFSEAVRMANDSDFGLQAGVFTNDLDRAWMAFEDLDVGAVMINDVPTFRVDSMPFGGNKASGLGREGIRYALEDATELRMLVLGLDRANEEDDRGR